MKIGVLGSGDVAKALAGGFVKHGHQVVLGRATRRDPSVSDHTRTVLSSEPVTVSFPAASMSPAVLVGSAWPGARRRSVMQMVVPFPGVETSVILPASCCVTRVWTM